VIPAHLEFHKLCYSAYMPVYYKPTVRSDVLSLRALTLWSTISLHSLSRL